MELWKLRRRPLSALLRLCVTLAAGITMFVFLILVGYILVKGIPNLEYSLFEWEYNSQNVSLVPALINTVSVTMLSLLIASPLGIFAAIYMNEYARKDNRLIAVVRIAAETLAGIPSIVYGLFGMLLFVVALRWGYSLAAGAFTMAVMILPIIMRTAEEALKSIPDSYREGSFGLGAGRLRTVFAIVLPPAVPGIMAGIILATGRVVGETAALIFTAGTVARVPVSLTSSVRTLSVHMYNLSSEGLHIKQAYATAVVLLALVIAINAISSALAGRIIGGRG
ncbi:MAG: phosphate ABC transporter permease PstA [Synergistaceae bacterium]|jgi:phosphate transport system permease protein|nr:phosphate ABC transporter permease PstA [Synergistaceae bacterium]